MNKKKTRGKYSIGGCENCRRKHRKCDKTSPKCLRCEAAGLECGGFRNELSWVTTTQRLLRDGRKPALKRPGNCQSSGQVNTSARIAPPDTIRPNVDDAISNFNGQPFHTEVSPNHVITTSPTNIFNTQITDSDIYANEQAPMPVQKCSEHALDFLGTSENLLDWPDLFSVDSLFSDYISAGFGNGESDVPEPQNASSPIILPSTAHNSDPARPLHPVQDRLEQDVVSNGLTFLKPTQAMALELDQNDTHMLFKHVKDHCFPQLWSSSIGRKSPLETHLTAAVLTFANMTYLAPHHISHASFTNLLALLAISSKHLATQLRNEEPKKSNDWNQYAERTWENAKHHFFHSLNTEVSPKVAKYKDVVMAVSSMISFSILYDRQSDARKYLVDAERLLLEQGLRKSSISGKTKLLHHTYTWNRIVSESTYVLRNSDSANVPMAAHLSAGSDKETFFERGKGSHMISRSMMPNINLDDFLHFEPHQQETDSPLRETVRETLHDIHLKQEQGISDSTFMMLYGVSETWLSLVSQTTRLANLMQTAKRGSKEDKSRLHELIEKRKGLLEHRVCSFAMTGTTASTSIDSNYPADVRSHEGQRTTRSHLVRALNCALIIFFYRRIYNVHPHILQQHVDVVLRALQEFKLCCEKEGHGGPGSPWPAFMAGCEAITKNNRDYFENWFDRAFARTGFTRLLTAKKCMQEVWERLDRFRASDNELMQRCWTWIHISEEQNLYILLS